MDCRNSRSTWCDDLRGQSREEAISKVKALALRVLADRLEDAETIPKLREVFMVPA